MTRFFIIHGTKGDPKGNWFPWLAQQLEAKGHEVIVPRFPTPVGQSVGSWIATFQEYDHLVDSDTIFVGHSLGPAFILHLLEQRDDPVRACYFISGFTGLLGDDEFDELNNSFVEYDFNWERICANCGTFVVVNSDDDPYVPLDQGHDLAVHLGVPLTLLPAAGHINLESGFKAFPFLLDLIEEELKAVDLSRA